jgi:hypothetical protein
MTHERSDSLKRAMRRDAVVLHDGVMHWLVRSRGEIVTYNVCTMEQESIVLPAHITKFKGLLHLGSYYSHDGRMLLRLLAYKGLMVYVWHQLPDGDFTSKAVRIDMEKKLRSLDSSISTRKLYMEFEWSGEGSNTVLLRIYRHGLGRSPNDLLFALDIEKKEMHVRRKSTPSSSVLLKVDLPSQLRGMKLFP